MFNCPGDTIVFNFFKKFAKKSTKVLTDFDFTFGLGDVVTVPDEAIKNKKVLKEKKLAVKKKTLQKSSAEQS